MVFPLAKNGGLATRRKRKQEAAPSTYKKTTPLFYSGRLPLLALYLLLSLRPVTGQSHYKFSLRCAGSHSPPFFFHREGRTLVWEIPCTEVAAWARAPPVLVRGLAGGVYRLGLCADKLTELIE